MPQYVFKRREWEKQNKTSSWNDPISFSLFPVNCAGSVIVCDDFERRTQPLLTTPNVKNVTLDCSVACGLVWTSLTSGGMGLKSGLENEKNA